MNSDLADILGPRRIPLLTGVVGSHAYGLATADSDHDSIGIYADPTYDLLGLTAPPESITSTQPGSDDYVFHEARKFLRLTLNGNPHVTELLWLDQHTHTNPWGAALINIRGSLSAAPLIRRAYLGYATGQFKRLAARGDGSFSSDTRKRTAKHARHLLRLLRQGFDFYATGHLTVRIPDTDREEIFTFGETVAAGDCDQAKAMIAFYESAYDNRTPALPAKPDHETAEAWLRALREDYA